MKTVKLIIVNYSYWNKNGGWTGHAAEVRRADNKGSKTFTHEGANNLWLHLRQAGFDWSEMAPVDINLTPREFKKRTALYPDLPCHKLPATRRAFMNWLASKDQASS